MIESKKTAYPLLYEFQLNLGDANKKLEQYVREEILRTQTLNEHHSNFGGWHSDRNLDLNLGDGSKRSELLIPLFLGLSEAMTKYIGECHS